MGIAVSNELAERMYVTTSGHPAILQQACQMVATNVATQSEGTAGLRVVSNDVVDDVLGSSEYLRNYIEATYGMYRVCPLAQLLALCAVEARAANGVSKQELFQRALRYRPAIRLTDLEYALSLLELLLFQRANNKLVWLMSDFPKIMTKERDVAMEIQNVSEEIERHVAY
jgi:hypothetical protein